MNVHRPRGALLAVLALAAVPAGPAAAQNAAAPAQPPATAPSAPAPSAAPATGEARYVIEQLVVNVNSAPDGSGTRVAILRSGDKVELLERSGEAAHVRLSNGRDGWVRGSYLMETEPLRLQLAARTAEVATLRQQLAASSAPRAPAAAGASAAPAPAGAAVSAPSPAAEDAGEDPGAAHGVAWGWLIGTTLIALGVGFALGWLVLDARIRRRYGGLRIY